MKTFKELYEACCAACEKRADIEEVKEPTGGLKDACWKGYTAVGMKMKNGRKVPNCVPANEEVEQIDELSKDTLASYNRKAWDDRQANQHKAADLSKKSVLYRGKNYTKDERDNAEKAHNELGKLTHKYGTRTKGIETSEKKWMAKEEVEQVDESSIMMTAAAALHNQPKYKERTAGQEKKRAEREAEKALHTPGKDAAKRRKYWVKKVNKLHGIPEETDKNQKLRDALAKVKNDFTKSHSDGKPTDKKPTPAPKPEPTSVGGGTDYYPKAPYGRRYMGDSVEMDGEQIDELSKGTLRRYIDDAGDQESDVRHTLKRTEKSKHISAGAKDELKKLADRRKAGIRLASDKRGYYKGSDAKANFTHGAAKVPATEETQKGKNVVPPTAGTIATTGGIQEEENENKPLGKVMRAGDGKKKFKVFVKNSKGNVVKVGFGDPNMEIKRDDPERRKNFRARHNCDTATDRTTPRYWSCRNWRASAKVEA